MRIPIATYRLQFRPDFGFREAGATIAYLAELGITDIYASPIFQARKGSTHGYDLVDPCRLNAELGSSAQFAELSNLVQRHAMGWLQDIVPNHMVFDAANPYIADILENGPGSPYRHYFDVNWEHYHEEIHGKILAPFLGQFYGHALEAGELRLRYGEQGFAVSYQRLRFPLKIETYLAILEPAALELRRSLGEEHCDYIQFLGILYVLKTLRKNTDNGERRSQVKFVKQNLWTLYTQNPSIHQAIEAVVQRCNGRSGVPESFNRLEAILADQWFHLAFWKVANEEINYRRFFNINDLISLRMEDPQVFRETHALVQDMLAAGQFTGLRIDHIDGLYDPERYLQRLRRMAPETYLVVEKILTDKEDLPQWPIQGTTGYDFMNALNGLFCLTDSARTFTRLYHTLTGQRQSYADLVYAKKKLIIGRSMRGDVNNLAHLLKKLASRHRYGSDITMGSLKQALVEVLALFPVYRCYISASGLRDTDQELIECTLDRAKHNRQELLNELEFIEKVLLGKVEEFLPEDTRPQWLSFSQRFQQLTGPLAAKGVEDTALYVYNRLLSLNEVGGNPARFGLGAAEFHDFINTRRQVWPHSMNATATHDSKRGEDMRARLNVLSELPGEWGQQVRNWSRLNRHKKNRVARQLAPDKNDEYFLYQTLVGVLPFTGADDPAFSARLKDYLIKAIREAKVHTAWLKPDKAYEDACMEFVDKLLMAGPDNQFLRSFIPFQKKVAYYGMYNSLAQTLLKITAPGIPDFYQGTELWDLHLVDPDNRQPVDYAARQAALEQLIEREQAGLPGLLDELLHCMPDGRIKLFLIHRALSARRRFATLFMEGGYRPLQCSGPREKHIFAFARHHENQIAVTIVPRFLAAILDYGDLPTGEFWAGTVLKMPDGAKISCQNVFTGAIVEQRGDLPVAVLLAQFPVGLLVGASPETLQQTRT